jgi:predicted DNA-binding transcriptional regulator AlpA
MNQRLPYPPPWQDKATLCAHICVSDNTVDAWVAQGVLPPPVKRGGKLMWKWDQVDQWLTNGQVGKSPDAEAERIRDATRRALENRAASY